MIKYTQLDNSISEKCCVALGNFDSMHLGHQYLLKETVRLAKENNLKSCCFTFSNIPLNFISGTKVLKHILSEDEKEKIAKELGFDYYVSLRFTEDICNTTAFDFAKVYLKEKLSCSIAVCGFNYSFGAKGKGNTELLSSYGEKLGFSVYVCDDVKVDGISVSSTLLREELTKGNISSYEKYTGRKYTVEGTVVQGQHLGAKMGFPTANISLSEDIIYPANGVYVTYVYVNNMKYVGITNIGHKPTVGEFAINAETNILKLNEDLYGKHIRLEFLEFVRPERKFSSIEELETQIAHDRQRAEEYL